MNFDELFQRANLKNIEYYACDEKENLKEELEYKLSEQVENAFKEIEKYLEDNCIDEDDEELWEHIYQTAEIFSQAYFEAGLFTGVRLGYRFCELKDN